MEEIEANTAPEEFNELAQSIATFLGRSTAETPAQLAAGRRPYTARIGRRAPDRMQEARQLQKLYQNNRRRAVQQVLAGVNKSCEIPLAILQDPFQHLAAHPVGEKDWPNVFDQAEPTPDINEALCRPFTAAEVSKGPTAFHTKSSGGSIGGVRSSLPCTTRCGAFYRAVRTLNARLLKRVHHHPRL